MSFDIDRESYSRILDSLYDGLYLTDTKRTILYWNKAAERITGFSADMVVGKSCSNNVLTHVDGKGNNLCRGLCPLTLAIADGESREAEVYLHHKNGCRISVSVRVSNLTDADDKVIGGVELFTDISRYKSIEERAKELGERALIGNLTRIANRNYMQNEFYIRFEERKRMGISFGILFIDIDHIKKFNDTHGHDVGDRVLKFVAETLSRNSRPFDTAGRWGGEEFVIIARNVNPKHLEEIGNRLRMLVENSYIVVNNAKLHVTISIGATLARDDDSMETLLKRADGLLYASKEAGRNRLTSG